MSLSLLLSESASINKHCETTELSVVSGNVCVNFQKTVGAGDFDQRDKGVHMDMKGR